MSNTNRFMIIVLIIVMTCFTLFYQAQMSFRHSDNAKGDKTIESLKSGTLIRDSRKLPLIKLVDDNGFDMTASSFKHQWSVFFFGYASCPDFCPKILSRLDAIGRYIPDEHLKKYFVTINPEIDSPRVLHDFLKSYAHHIHGLTGSKDDIFNMVQFFHLTADKTPNYQGHIEHSASLVMLSPEGKMCAIFNDLSDSKAVVDDIYYIQRTL